MKKDNGNIYRVVDGIGNGGQTGWEDITGNCLGIDLLGKTGHLTDEIFMVNRPSDIC